jgi:hypothetical protein
VNPSAYQITVTGWTYTGSTNFLFAQPTFTPEWPFTLSGTLEVTPPVNGGLENYRDVAISTGNIGTGGPGVIEFTTQDAGVNVATVIPDAQQDALTINIDPTISRTIESNTMYDSYTGITTLPHQITAGQMVIHFSDGGRSVSGSLVFEGTGYIEAGTIAIAANFQSL